MRATLVNIFGGPGSGKSTFAPGVVHFLKKYGFEAFYVPEEAKYWAMGGCRIDEGTQLEIVFRQYDAERRYYPWECFIVTDAPLEINGFYCWLRTKKEDYFNIVKRIREQNNGTQLNFWLQNDLPYQPHGRYQSESEAGRVADQMFTSLDYLNMELAPRDPSMFVQNYLMPHVTSHKEG